MVVDHGGVGASVAVEVSGGPFRAVVVEPAEVGGPGVAGRVVAAGGSGDEGVEGAGAGADVVDGEHVGASVAVEVAGQVGAQVGGAVVGVVIRRGGGRGVEADVAALEAFTGVAVGDGELVGGGVAEPALFPVQLTEALDAGLDPTGATAAATLGRRRTNTNFKRLIGPCDSCKVLVKHYDIDFRMAP
ncbi:hypothetical protein [Embleya sp. MST-111070]|uniref:hypothetical protein n=1 Tax=Embleya sp. MST-111070 TaxID=3398231 RepID=UPI003F73EF58